MATAARGAAMTFAGRLTNDSAPKTGSSKGAVAICAAAVANTTLAAGDACGRETKAGSTHASASDAATDN